MNIVHISDLLFYKKSKEEIVDEIKLHRINNLELFIEPLDEEYTEKMIHVLENCNFDSITFHGPFRRCNLAVLTDESWQKTLYSYEQSFKIASKYKPKFMVLHSNENVPGNDITPSLRAQISDKIEKLVALGKSYDIDVVIENVGTIERRNIVFSQSEYEELILKNDYKVLIDIGHAHLNSWDMERLIKKLKDNIIGYHFHNNDGQRDLHMPIAKGDINYFTILNLVSTYTADASIVLEYEVNESVEDAVKDKKIFEEILNILQK